MRRNNNGGEGVGGPADVAHENEVADFDAVAPSITLAFQPCVKGGLRFFKQRDMVITGLFGSAPGQFACFFVEGSGHSEEHVLFRKSELPLLPRLAALPHSAQVLQELR